MSCKLYLVPEDVIQTWKSEQRSQQVDKPIENTLGQMDRDMQSVLKNKTMSDYDKEQMYAQKLGTYVTMRDQRTGTPPVQQQQQQQPLGVSDTKHKLPDDILASVPKMYRTKADAFLKYIQSDNDISWDSNGQLILNKKIIPKSHLVDLMHDALRLRKKVKRAKGWRELSRHLRSKNIPREILGNEEWSTPPPSPIKEKPPVTFSTRTLPRKSKVLGKQKIRQWIKLQDDD